MLFYFLLQNLYVCFELPNSLSDRVHEEDEKKESCGGFMAEGKGIGTRDGRNSDEAENQ